MFPFHIIVAVDSHNGIGKKGLLPWHLKGDMQHFKEITCASESEARQNLVIMGRKTWDSLPSRFRPLPERMNLVLTRDSGFAVPPGVMKADSLNGALKNLLRQEFRDQVGQIFVIGGQQVFEAAIRHPQCQKLYVTHILKRFDCDAFFPDFSRQFKKISSSPQLNENGLGYFFAEYMPV
ncbi:MAG: dihydrofolate reductase [Candidatus Omnitrophota bacterium]